MLEYFAAIPAIMITISSNEYYTTEILTEHKYTFLEIQEYAKFPVLLI